MKIIDNINSLWGDDLKAAIKSGSKLKIAASSFSIYAYEALKEELSKVESLEFIFTQPTFVTDKATDKFSKEHREFFIPKQMREKSLYGTEFEIQLKNKLTQKAIAKECADWIRSKVTFCSNSSNAQMQQFACVSDKQVDNVYMPLQGFTAVDLGYQRGNAISNMINKFDGAQDTAAYLQLFEQIWNNKDKLEDVTENICQHIESVYEENSPEKIYFLMLYNILVLHILLWAIYICSIPARAFGSNIYTPYFIWANKVRLLLCFALWLRMDAVEKNVFTHNNLRRTEILRLEKKVHNKNLQFNRRTEFNRELNLIKKELRELKS